MLAIRLQRTGRKGQAHYRVVVQDSRRTPTSGNIVMSLGSYNPHTKAVNIDTEKATYYLSNGAQPSSRVVAILKSEGVAMPSWVKEKSKQERSIKNTEKLRRNQPAVAEPVTDEPVAEEVAGEEPAVEAAADTAVEEAASEEVATKEEK